jgi:hypothetical protein
MKTFLGGGIMIYITGDTHGDIDFEKLKVYFAHRYASPKTF